MKTTYCFFNGGIIIPNKRYAEAEKQPLCHFNDSVKDGYSEETLYSDTDSWNFIGWDSDEMCIIYQRMCYLPIDEAWFSEAYWNIPTIANPLPHLGGRGNCTIILIVINRLSKYSTYIVAKVFTDNVVKLDGMLCTILNNQDWVCTSLFGRNNSRYRRQTRKIVVWENPNPSLI